MHDFRMSVAGKAKAEQIRQTGAEICVTPCANCKNRLKELIEYYKVSCTVLGLHDLILKAIYLPGGKTPAEQREVATTV